MSLTKMKERVVIGVKGDPLTREQAGKAVQDFCKAGRGWIPDEVEVLDVVADEDDLAGWIVTALAHWNWFTSDE